METLEGQTEDQVKITELTAKVAELEQKVADKQSMSDFYYKKTIELENKIKAVKELSNIL